MARPPSQAKKATEEATKKAKKKDRKQNHYRCTFSPLLDLVQKHHKSLEKHVSAIEDTQFGPLFKAFFNGEICDTSKLNDSIFRILQTYDKDSRKFHIGKKCIELKVEDVAIIFGMNACGEDGKWFCKGETQTINKWRKENWFCSKFLEHGKLHNTSLYNYIESILEDDKEASDIPRMVILYMIGTILFPTNNHTIPLSYTRALEDLDVVNRMRWAYLIHKNLMDSIHERDDLYNIPGCTILILIWFAEHVDLAPRICGKEATTPRVTRWDLKILGEAISAAKFDEIEDEKVYLELRELSETEKGLLGCEKVQLRNKVLEVEGEEDEMGRLKRRNSELEEELTSLRNRLASLESQPQNHLHDLKNDEASDVEVCKEAKKKVTFLSPIREKNVLESAIVKGGDTKICHLRRNSRLAHSRDPVPQGGLSSHGTDSEGLQVRDISKELHDLDSGVERMYEDNSFERSEEDTSDRIPEHKASDLSGSTTLYLTWYPTSETDEKLKSVAEDPEQAEEVGSNRIRMLEKENSELKMENEELRKRIQSLPYRLEEIVGVLSGRTCLRRHECIASSERCSRPKC